jgi:hypothetical protein
MSIAGCWIVRAKENVSGHGILDRNRTVITFNWAHASSPVCPPERNATPDTAAGTNRSRHATRLDGLFFVHVRSISRRPKRLLPWLTPPRLGCDHHDRHRDGPWKSYALVHDARLGHWIIAIVDAGGLVAIGFSLLLVAKT